VHWGVTVDSPVKSPFLDGCAALVKAARAEGQVSCRVDSRQRTRMLFSETMVASAKTFSQSKEREMQIKHRAAFAVPRRAKKLFIVEGQLRCAAARSWTRYRG
jgi:hypothetical protein